MSDGPHGLRKHARQRLGSAAVGLGASSRDIRLRATIDITAPALPVALDGMSTLREWLADPTGSVLLRKAIGTDEPAGPEASSATRNA
jgi:beta-glucosidase